MHVYECELILMRMCKIYGYLCFSLSLGFGLCFCGLCLLSFTFGLSLCGSLNISAHT